MINLLVGLSTAFMISISSVFAQSTTRSSLALLDIAQNKAPLRDAVEEGKFVLSNPLWSTPTPAGWVLTAVNAFDQGQTPILSKLCPLWQENIRNPEFEQVQSVIIPGGILDGPNKLVYLENSAKDVVVLNIHNGKLVRRISNICCPIAIVDNCLIGLSRTQDQGKSSYDLVMMTGRNFSRCKARWNTILLPDWLELPTDGERQKFVFSVHCYSWILSIAWQASTKQMFPHPLFFVMPPNSQPTAVQGRLSVDLKSQGLLSQSMEESNADFLGYLTDSENTLPAQIVPDSKAVAIKNYNSYLFSLTHIYPPEHNISGAGVVRRREIQVEDIHTGKTLWIHTLPAAFIPLSF